MYENKTSIRYPDPHIATANYLIRQQLRLLPFTGILLLCMMLYTVVNVDFILDISIMNWVILMVLMFYSRKKIISEMAEAIKIKKLGKSMDWTPLVYYGWTHYLSVVVFTYWLAVIIWLIGFEPTGTIYELYGVDPSETLTNGQK